MPELEIQYADFAVWQQGWLQGEEFQQQLEYWRRQLANLPILDLPTRPVSPEGPGQQGEIVWFSFNKDQSTKLSEYGRREGVTLFMLLLAGFQWLLSRYSGHEDIAVGTIIANRNRKELESLIGFFANTLVLRTDVSGAPSSQELIRRVREITLAAYAHQELPFETLVEKLNPERRLGRTPLVQAMFVLENNSEVRSELRGLVLTQKGTENPNIKFELTLLVQQTECLEVGIEYNKDLFDKSLITRMAENYRTLMERMVNNPETPLWQLSTLTENERRQLLVEWNQISPRNDTRTASPAGDCVHELFEAQALRSPQAVALLHEDRELSYAELNFQANRLAHYLRGLGVRPESLVAICTDRGLEMLIAVLAVLKAGGAYLPLDPTYPAARFSYMLNDSAPQVVLTQKHLFGLFSGVGNALPVLDLTDGVAWHDQPASNPECFATGRTQEHLAYVIYTSGSTGNPKGVCVGHVNLNHFLADIGDTLGANGNAGRWLAVTNVTFDISILEILWTLTRGFQVVIGDTRTLLQAGQKDVDCHASIRRLSRRESADITHLQCTPSLVKLLLADDNSRPILARAKKLLLGGEPLPTSLIAELKRTTKAEIFNMYGPTETTIWSSVHALGDKEEKEIVSIGKPFGCNQVYIMDDWGQLAPIGAAGELYIGGEQVARGYLNRPELTAERFVPNPFDRRVGARLYRTGDRVRWNEIGELEYLGRLDHQVKIRGNRVELGEIESVLLQHPKVRQSAVLMRPDPSGSPSLVAYVSLHSQIIANELRNYVKDHLPEYMVPSAVVVLSVLPLTANGKLDRKALPAPKGDAYVARGYEEPHDEIEKAVASIWAEVLKLERVGRRDNFFELGGHSLQAVTVIERMRRKGLQIDVRALFAAPTVAGLAAAASPDAYRIEVPENRIPADCDAITPDMLPLVKLSAEEIGRIIQGVPGGARNVQEIYPLAPLQEGILFHHLMRGEGDPYVGAQRLIFLTRPKLDSYLEHLQAVVDRHDILRTTVMWEGLPEPVQVVRRKTPLLIEEIDLDPAVGEAGQQLYERLNPRHHRMDVSQTLLKVFIAEDREKHCWQMMQLQHQLAGDHTTLELMQEEIQEHLLGRADQLPTPLPFRNLVAQARLGISREEHEAFFRQLLGDVEEPTAPLGLLDAQSDGTGIQQEQMVLDSGLAQRIRERARALGVSSASLCHLAWAQVLARVSDREDVVFGTVLLGRMQSGAGADRVMGLFINTLPVRIQIGNEGVEASVRRTHRLLAELLRHEHASLALAQRCSAVRAPTPLFSALLNYRHSVNDAVAPSEEVRRAYEGIEILHEEERTNYAVTLSIDDMGEGFGLTAQTPATVDPMRICEFMRTALEALVQALETDPAAAVGTLDVLPLRERRQVLQEWNDTRREFPDHACVHDLFEEQVRRTPEAVALVYEDADLSYSELNARANRVAHYLRSIGVKPDTRVAICVDRSFEMMVGLLGVLKAGGAYLPMDPGYPVDRLSYMLQNSAATVLLTQGHLTGLFAGLKNCPPIINLNAADHWKDQPETDPDDGSFGLSSGNLVYVIYTSGSTGTPKGVMVEHRGVVNRLVWMQRAYEIDQHDAVLQKTPITFDVSVWELFWPLLAGARLVIARPDGHKDPAYLAEVIQRCKITVAHFVPSMLQVFVEHPNVTACSSLGTVVCSGEALPAVLARRFQERLPHATLYNLYGPTETTVDVSTWTCLPSTDLKQIIVPIGRPIANTRLYILDAHLRPVPVGVAGELYIGGVQVARGYMNRPDLTAERFLKDPFTNEADARLYRSGDLCRWLADGAIEFLGRNDFQVKIRGFRIELGEIEARLMEYPGVREAVVMAYESVPGEKRLIAYYTTQIDLEQAAISQQHLRKHIAAILPEYMVPVAYVRLESLPLTASGKLNRKMLPDPEGFGFAARVYEPPQGDIEITLAAIWSDVLNLERVGRNDNFFELGGHSLLAVKLMERARRKGLQLDVRALFATPTLAEVAAAVVDRPEIVEVPANLIPSFSENPSEIIELRI
ncbi:MAG TPA: amino acid adenylation domain-containing protein [Candidatus Angelobacter sp.]